MKFRPAELSLSLKRENIFDEVMVAPVFHQDHVFIGHLEHVFQGVAMSFTGLNVHNDRLGEDEVKGWPRC